MTTTMSEITVDKAIDAIEAAAEEIPADDFIDYSTILDIHLSYALDFFNQEDQAKLLSSLKSILKQYGELTQNIAWDLIGVLLPFVKAPISQSSSANVDVTKLATECLLIAALEGNAREVFLKTLAAISSLTFGPSSSLSTNGDGEEESEETQVPLTPLTPAASPEESRKNGFLRYKLLLELLTHIHSRITTSFPSKFLSQSLITVLRTFTRSVDSLGRSEVEEIIGNLLAFVDSVQPSQTKKKRRMTQSQIGADGRPTLPPRTSTASNVPLFAKLSLEDDSQDDEETRSRKERERAELDMQLRLLQSFVSHIVEVYITRCPSEAPGELAEPKSQSSHLHPDTALDNDDQPSSMTLPPKRGINLHLASRYLKSSKFIQGGQIQSELPQPATNSENWSAILDMAYQLSLTTRELQELCCGSDDDNEDLEEPRTPVEGLSAMPRFADDIPLSKIGSLMLLASRIFEKESITTSKIALFPDHKNITLRYLGTGSTEIGILDAVLFLGAWAVSSEGGGLGETPDAHVPEDGWLQYLQIYALLATTSPSALTRLLAHNHLAQVIHMHPEETVRLAYIKDTLEHCPFESLKASIIGMLKDEVWAATSADAGKEQRQNIFSSPALIDELSSELFPDLSDALDTQHPTTQASNETRWDWFVEEHPVHMATANFLLFLLMREHDGAKGVCGVGQWIERIEGRWLGRLREWLDNLSEADIEIVKRRGLELDVDVLRNVLSRVEEVRKEVGL